jgi:hypothetical protein
MIYEVVFFDGWGVMPAYYLLDAVEGDTPEDALAANLERIMGQVRRRFGLDEDDVSEKRIQETIYVLRENAAVSARHVAPVDRRN